MRRVLRRLQALDVANHAIGEAVSALGTLDASVLQTHLKRIETEFFREFVQHRFSGEL